MSKEPSFIAITGGNKGIGLSIARVFARESEMGLLLIARNESDLAEAAEICRSEGAKKVEVLAMDLLKPEKEKMELLVQKNIRVLVNNAGVYLYGTLTETTPGQFEDQFRLNTLTAYNITQPLLPTLKKQDHGLIVNICSRASLEGFGDSGAYAMAKHALLGYTRSLREELKDQDIAVTAINLGQTWSTSWKDIEVDKNDLIDPEDVGQLILTLSKLSPRTVVEEMLIMPQKGQIPPV